MDRSSPPTQSLKSSRVTAGGNLPFHEKWRTDQVFIHNTRFNRLYAHENRLFFVSYEDNNGTGRLKALNTNDGSLLWKTEPLPNTVMSLLVADQERVYLALSDEIIAYDLSTGDAQWNAPLLGSRTSYKLDILENTLMVYSEEDISLDGSEELLVRKYDSRTGLQIDTQRSLIASKHSSLLLSTMDYEYWTDAETLWAINTKSKHEQWRVTLDNRIEYEPLFDDSIFIFASGIFSDIVAIDNISGKQTWKYQDKVVSDLTIKDGVLYAIKADAAIVGINPETGNEVGSINLEPQFTESGSRSLAFLIAVYENLLFTYYGDSQELIAFSR
jgi:outer membrane protein assembly factor BamB